MDLISSYDKLYERWLKEFESIDILPLSEGDFKDFKDIINFFSDYYEEGENSVKFSLIDQYKKNISYLFEDLMEMRKIKIINVAFQMKELDLSYLIEAEQLLYKSLVGSIKGYQKVLASASLEDIQFPTTKLPAITAETPQINERSLLSKSEESEIELENEEINSPSKPKKKSSLTSETEKEKKKVLADEQHLEERISNVESVKSAGTEYVLLRFIEDSPPLVGFDTLTYGPFEKEDVSSIPYKNAIILIQEKVAKQIDIK